MQNNIGCFYWWSMALDTSFFSLDTCYLQIVFKFWVQYRYRSFYFLFHLFWLRRVWFFPIFPLTHREKYWSRWLQLFDTNLHRKTNVWCLLSTIQIFEKQNDSLEWPGIFVCFKAPAISSYVKQLWDRQKYGALRKKKLASRNQKMIGTERVSSNFKKKKS